MGPGLPRFKLESRCMERLNALEWADGLALATFGIRVGIRVTRRGSLALLLGQLPPGWRPSTTRDVQWLYSLIARPSGADPRKTFLQLYTGHDLLTRGTDHERIRNAFGADLQTTLALVSPWRVFVHAGAVGWRGRAILIPGGSGSGKTTLTAALVRAGAILFSDEFAVLDRRGRAHPYPLPLRFKKGEGCLSTPVAVEALGGVGGDRPLPVGLILSTRFRKEGAGRFRKLSRGGGALALMAHAVQARLRPGRVMEAAGRAAEGAMALRGPRGEAEEMVDTLLGLW